MQSELDVLAWALYVTIDDLFVGMGRLRPTGRPPRLTDSELVCLAVAQVLLGFNSERRWLRFAYGRLGHLFPYLPQQPACNKGYAGREFEDFVRQLGATLVRSDRRRERRRYGQLGWFRQRIESVNDTLKGQLGLEQHGGGTCLGVVVRVAQRLLALTACVWHNWLIDAPSKRSLVAYDH